MPSPPRPRILVVEDEPAIRSGLCDLLAYHGWSPTPAASGEDGLRAGLRDAFALALLDVRLPGIDGFEVCRTLRAAHPRLPILVLTARGAEPDVLEGFRCGGDDYVVKPFSVAELIARIQALLRRAGRGTAERGAPFHIGAWRIDPERMAAEREGGGRIELSRRELGILWCLAREDGRIVSRRMLLREVWGFDAPERIETRTVDVHVARLRRKLGGEGRRRIETVRGEGYRLGTERP